MVEEWSMHGWKKKQRTTRRMKKEGEERRV